MSTFIHTLFRIMKELGYIKLENETSTKKRILDVPVVHVVGTTPWKYMSETGVVIYGGMPSAAGKAFFEPSDYTIVWEDYCSGETYRSYYTIDDTVDKTKVVQEIMAECINMISDQEEMYTLLENLCLTPTQVTAEGEASNPAWDASKGVECEVVPDEELPVDGNAKLERVSINGNVVDPVHYSLIGNTLTIRKSPTPMTYDKATYAEITKTARALMKNCAHLIDSVFPEDENDQF